MRMRCIVFLLVCWLTFPLLGLRKALVIGNAAYTEKPLKNSVNDAMDIAAALSRLGFVVNTHYNVDKQEFYMAVGSFVEGLTPNDEVVFFYSGHGVQIDGKNYLIPVREFIDNVARCKNNSYESNMLLEELKVASISIVILDACRDNPFAFTRNLNRGLATVQTAPGSQYIIHSTGEGKVAEDGSGRNSPFTESLLAHIDKPIKITDLVEVVTNEVAEKTNETQTPWAAGSLRRSFSIAQPNMSISPNTPKTMVQPPILPAKPKPSTIYYYGSLDLASDVPAEVYLDGEYILSLPRNGKALIDSILVGTHELKLRYQKLSKSELIEIPNDGVLSLNIPLEQKTVVIPSLPVQSKPKQEAKLSERVVRVPRTDEEIKSLSQFVLINGGSFQMGSPLLDAHSWERPRHKVRLNSFYLGKTEVTQKLWTAIMGSNPSTFVGDDLPVTDITWYQAIEFCNKLSKSQGLEECYTIAVGQIDEHNSNPEDKVKNVVEFNMKANGYRLPTESEWEYAARSGDNKYQFTYSGSNNLDSIAWYNKNSQSTLHQVGTKVPNKFGVFDMNGNVFEWCWDYLGLFDKELATDPIGPRGGSYRIIRGGSWMYGSPECRITYRGGSRADLTGSDIGLRLVRNATN